MNDDACLPDLSFLSDAEKSKIIEVLNRDEQLRRKQTEKYLKLKQEIDLIESKSIDIPTDHIQTANVCVRCRQTFGYFFNTGEFCHQCGFKVCQKCQVNQVENGFLFKNNSNKAVCLCILCHKYNQYLVQTGDWIYSSDLHPKNSYYNSNIINNYDDVSNKENFDNNKRIPFSKSPVQKQSSLSSNGTIKSPLSGSQLITLSLLPNKKNEIIEEIESVSFKKSTLSKRYSTIKKAKSQSLLNDKIQRINNNNEIQDWPQRKCSDSSQSTSIASSANLQTPKLATPDISLTPSNYSLSNTYKNMNIESNLEKASNKVKALSNIFNFSNNNNNNNNLHEDATDDTKTLINNSDKSVPIINGDDFGSVTSSELDTTSIFASDTLGNLTKRENPSPRIVQENITSSKDNLKNPINDQNVNKGLNIFNKNLNRDKSHSSLAAFRNEPDLEMNQMDQMFENFRENTMTKKDTKLAYKRDPSIPNVVSSVNSSPISKNSSIVSMHREMPVDLEEEYLKLQTETDNNHKKVLPKNVRSFKKPKNPFHFERAASIKSISEHFSHDPGIKIGGKISIRLFYEKKSSNLSVNIFQCENLSRVKKEFPNSYVKVYLKHRDKDNEKDKNSKRKTPVIRNNCNPFYDETFRYTISSSELSSHLLQISVWHKDTFGRNKFLGEITIQLKDDLLLNDSSSRIWYDLKENANV
ncbi:unnamed protein product [Brachionus calyciflorus]|uniref:Uncharacterized protein n=1 Tax=Brachionus calyciflorus TaxID=104777 RepID=A0A813QL64_9BILA|nr:unnamed protein product [Brachionus calyciflorus]